MTEVTEKLNKCLRLRDPVASPKHFWRSSGNAPFKIQAKALRAAPWV